MNEKILTAVAITSALFQTLKQVDVKDQLHRFYPLLALALGTGVGVFLFQLDFLGGLLVGLSANGTYSVVKEPVKVGVKAVKSLTK